MSLTELLNLPGLHSLNLSKEKREGANGNQVALLSQQGHRAFNQKEQGQCKHPGKVVNSGPITQEADNQSYGTMTEMTAWGPKKSPLVTFAE